MFEGILKMNIDDLKKEYKNMRIPQMGISINEFNTLDSFIKTIRKQDKNDEKYILHNKIIPIIVGLFLLTILMLINPMKSVILLSGMFLVYSGLIYTLILLFLDYKNILNESFDLNLLAYLEQKENRLKTWHATPAKYRWTFTIFISGLIMMVLGNTSLMRDFSIEYIILLLTGYLVVLTTCWIIGEHFYQKRHKIKHQPLLKTISELKEELKEN